MLESRSQPPAEVPDRKFNPEMFVVAREEQGLTQGELAKALGVTQGTISKVENQLITPTAELLDRAALRLGCQVSFFFTCPRFRALPVTFYRKKVKLPVAILKRVHALAARKRLELESLLRSADVPENVVPSFDLKASGMTPAQAAWELRVRWHVPRGPVENVVTLIEGKGVVIFPVDFGTDLIAGLSTFEPGDGLPPVIFINSRCPMDRLRFTLMHELGHIMFHSHLPMPPNECEGEADEFASEFLMPASDIRGFLGGLSLEAAVSLKRVWKVAMSALIMRAAQLERISEARKRSLFIEMSKMGWRTREPVDLPIEMPTLHQELARAHLDQLGYTEQQLSKALHVAVDRFRAEYLDQQQGLRLVRK